MAFYLSCAGELDEFVSFLCVFCESKRREFIKLVIFISLEETMNVEELGKLGNFGLWMILLKCTLFLFGREYFYFSIYLQ